MSLRSVQDHLRAATAVLTEAGLDNAPGDARHLVAAALNLPRGRLTLHLRDPVAEKDAEALGHLLSDRLNRRPVSRILGRRAFFGHDFSVTTAVLDPRPDTETLVERALALPFRSVLDIGTGSGCILISLLAARPGARGAGSDISAAALKVAADNARRIGVGARATFLRSDWFADVAGAFDMIVSNPPYIAAAEMAGLAPEVRDHDPRVALTDDSDGLSAYRRIAGQAGAHLKPGGHLLVEIGSTQGGAVQSLLRGHGFANVQLFDDIDGRPRVVQGEKPG